MSGPLRVAVSGGAGFIGSHVVEHLRARGHTVLVVDDMSHPCGVAAPDGVEVLHADAGSPETAAALARFRPDAAVHLAAKGGVIRALREPAAHVRAVLASSVAFYSAACAAGVRAIVSASSGGAVYGDPRTLPVGEDTAPAPRSAYGAEKLAEEAYLGGLGRTHGVRTLALRYGNVYGPRQDGTGEAGVVAITSHRLLGGLPPVVFGDGTQSRDFVHVGDVADATVAALTADAEGALNIGTGRSTSVAEVVRVLTRAAGYTGEVEIREGRPGEVRHGRLDVRAAEHRLGWKPRVAVEDGLAATYSWFAEQDREPMSSDVTRVVA